MAKVTIKGDQMTIVLDLEKDQQPSKSGKNIVIASTHGNEVTDCVYKGKSVKLGVNAFIKA